MNRKGAGGGTPKKIVPSLQGRTTIGRDFPSMQWSGSLKSCPPVGASRGAGGPGTAARALLVDTAGTTYTFTVPAPLVGHRCSVRRVFHDPRYRAFKDSVGLYALRAGFRTPTKLTLTHPAQLSCLILWAKRPRIDWVNVVKAIEDSLFPQDRYVMPGYFDWYAGTGIEEVQIILEIWEEQKAKSGGGG